MVAPSLRNWRLQTDVVAAGGVLSSCARDGALARESQLCWVEPDSARAPRAARRHRLKAWLDGRRNRRLAGGARGAPVAPTRARAQQAIAAAIKKTAAACSPRAGLSREEVCSPTGPATSDARTPLVTPAPPAKALPRRAPGAPPRLKRRPGKRSVVTDRGDVPAAPCESESESASSAIMKARQGGVAQSLSSVAPTVTSASWGRAFATPAAKFASS